MNGRSCDIAIVGGGLAGGLIAAALHRKRPDLSLALIEAGDVLGGNHRWSWFGSDLSAEGTALLSAFAHTQWNDGYDIAFPGLRRRLGTPYRSLASADFDAGLRAMLPDSAIRSGAGAATLGREGVTLADGERIMARTVIDCRGQPSSAHLQAGWQVFLGHHLRTRAPHGVERPVIMDATVEQAGIADPGASRFVYLLPLSDRDIFIEDTYYADSPDLDRGLLEARIEAYCAQRGWNGELIEAETGVLPVIIGGDFAAFTAEQRLDGVGRAGALAGFVHPLTSYTMPFAVDTALAIADAADLSDDALSQMLAQRARRHWRATGFYRLLGKMLFGAAEQKERWRIFERFYRLPENLIERFYAGRSTATDKARIVIGKPPVPISRAIGALMGGSPASKE